MLLENDPYKQANTFNLLRRATAGLDGLYNHIARHACEVDFRKAALYPENKVIVEYQPGSSLLAKRYRFLSKLGEGTFAHIFIVEDTYHPSRQKKAVKMMKIEYNSIGNFVSDNSKVTPMMEAQRLRDLNTADTLEAIPLPRLYDTFYHNGRFCMVLELLCPGSILSHPPPSHPQDKLKVLKKMAIQLCTALHFLHQRRLIHADLRPENILYKNHTSSGLKLIDFGNCVSFTETNAYHDNFEIQTLIYRAPEVLIGVPFTSQIDLWSLGCVLCEWFFEQPLFPGRDRRAILEKITTQLGPIPETLSRNAMFRDDLLSVQRTLEQKPSSFRTTIPPFLHRQDPLLIDFLLGLLAYDPQSRLTALQALSHPFLTSISGWHTLWTPNITEPSVCAPTERSLDALLDVFANVNTSAIFLSGASSPRAEEPKIVPLKGETVEQEEERGTIHAQEEEKEGIKIETKQPIMGQNISVPSNEIASPIKTSTTDESVVDVYSHRKRNAVTQPSTKRMTNERRPLEKIVIDHKMNSLVDDILLESANTVRVSGVDVHGPSLTLDTVKWWENTSRGDRKDERPSQTLPLKTREKHSDGKQGIVYGKEELLRKREDGEEDDFDIIMV